MLPRGPQEASRGLWEPMRAPWRSRGGSRCWFAPPGPPLKPYPPPELILELPGAIFAAPLPIYNSILFNLYFSNVLYRFLSKLQMNLKGFSPSGPRILQYLTANLKAFAYCRESLRKRFRSLQNAPKRPPRGLPGPLWEPMRAPWRSKLPLKNPQEVPKRHQNVQKNP